MKRKPFCFFTLGLVLVFAGPVTAQSVESLASWNDGKAKQSIIDFVAKVTQEGSPDFVPPAERIAVFDNDGTLWAGRPMYFQPGGGIEFMRPWSEQVYGIPPEQVIGSRIKVEYELRDGEPVLVRLPELDFYDDKEDKPVTIHQQIGRRPIAAFGNSDGDLQMLQWTTAGDGPRFALYVHHTDGEREWAYDREASMGRLDEGLDQAQAKGWTLVDMKQDWKVIYPGQK